MYILKLFDIPGNFNDSLCQALKYLDQAVDVAITAFENNQHDDPCEQTYRTLAEKELEAAKKMDEKPWNRGMFTLAYYVWI